MTGPTCDNCLDAKWLYYRGEWLRCGECNPEPPTSGGEALRDLSMEQVARANAEALEGFIESGWNVARKMPELIGDDVRDEFDRLGYEVREPRVLGPAMRALAAAGAITPSDLPPRLGHREVNHARPQRVWISLVYEEAHGHERLT